MSPQLDALETSLRMRLARFIYSNDHEGAAREVGRLVLRAYATGQARVSVGACGADAEIHRLDFGVFPWGDDAWMER